MGSILAINLHGQINVPGRMKGAMRALGVERRFSATVVPDDDSTVGSLRLCKDYLAWAPLDRELLVSLLRSRAMVSERKRLDESALGELGFKDYDELSGKIMAEGARLSSIEGLRPFFTLSPPKGGFKRSTRRQYGEGGVLGANPKLGEIVRRMI